MSKTLRSIIVLAVLALFAAPLYAGSVTLTWDANTETNITGYTVFYGTQSGVYTFSQSLGKVTTWNGDNLTMGQTYYFAVQAVNSDGLTSPLSDEVSTTIPGVSPSGETEAHWMARFGITDLTADPDGDGVTNFNELLNGTDPFLPNVWTLAEGSTGFFKERLAITNPGTDQADITVTFLREGTTPIVQQYLIPGMSRTTVRVNDIPGLQNISLSAMVTAQRGGVMVERTMTWGGTDKMDSAHTGKAVPKPQTSWYFAEGDVSLFDTYLLLANGNAFDVNVDVVYMLNTGQTVSQSYVVLANRRRTIYTNNIPGLSGSSFAMTVQASAPIATERAMYFSTTDTFWKGGHDSAGVPAPSTQWFIAEGHTGGFFAEYVLLANPNPAVATATVRYLLPTGAAVTQSYTLAPTSRTSILVNDVPGLANTDVSASIASTLPIVAERSMYWPGRWGQWYKGHNATALPATGTKWTLAEGETGGANNMISYILMVNPTAQDANVTVTIIRDNALPPIVVGKIVKANSRLTVPSTGLGLGSGEQFGATVESTNGVPIAVERAMYWDSNGKVWSAGTSETGFLLK